MVKEEVFLKINKDLISYLDNINLNYGIAITDENTLVYNNMNEEEQEISKDLKNFLNRLYAKTEIINFLENENNIEKNNLEVSKNIITKEYHNISESKLVKHLVNNLLFTKENNIKILKYDNFKHYPLKCIIPIYTDFFKGSLIVLTNETDITQEIKESFFRFSKGLLFIITYYINNGDYSEYKLF